MLEEVSLNGFFLICNLIYFPNHLWNSSTGSAYSLGNTSICSEDRSSKTMFTVPSKSIVQMAHVRVVVIVHKSFWKKSFLRFHWSTFRPLFFGVNHKQKLELVWCLLKKNIKNNFFITFFLGKPKAKMMYPIYQLHNNSCVKKWELGFSLSKWNNFCLQKLSKGEGRATEILRLWI